MTGYAQTSLCALIASLRSSLSILHKQDIQMAANALGQYVQGVEGAQIRLGDDCAAIPDGESYLLMAAEGIWPQLVTQDPWFAGWCAVMVNLSDIAAMGGSAIAVVDALWSQSVERSRPLWDGMQAAAGAYGVPIVGGHTNCHSEYDGLAVAVMGRANRLMTSFDARPGEALVMVVNMEGAYYKNYPFWNAATKGDPLRLRSHLKLLPKLAESGLCGVGKDISMGGLAGTLLMLCEASGCGASLNLDEVPRPNGVKWEKWLTSFPSFGFLLSLPLENVDDVKALFCAEKLVCQAVGEVVEGSSIFLTEGSEKQLFWEGAQALTGFGGA
ncbi:MAG: sll0787 family AIR synthase-like protein [Phormidesmis sp.]